MTRVIYLHGLASGPSSSKARFFREYLGAAGVDLEVPELDGGDFEHLTVTGQLAVVERCAGGRPVSLIGSSLGGYLAALYAARHAEVSRVVLLAPAFGFARRWVERLGPLQVEEWCLKGAMEVFHYGAKENRKLGWELLADAADYEEFPDFRQPVMIFHGAHDDVVPARYSQEFAASHPDVELEILDSGHEMLNVLELMGPRVLEFLRG